MASSVIFVDWADPAGAPQQLGSELQEEESNCSYHIMSENSTVVTASASHEHQSTDAEVAWLRRCLPIFMQPDIDIKNKNDLIKVFYRFERQPDSGRLDCKLCIVFAGESSYNRLREDVENTLATVFYRTFNRRTYKRTADINYLEYRDVSLDANSPSPWKSIYSIDHGGEQQWAQGQKANVWNWFSLMHHYVIEVPYADWKICPLTDRPHIFLNTCNHMIGQQDNNPQMSKTEWVNYTFEEGDADDAFDFVVAHVPTKFNLYSYCCFWKARNGGGWCDRHRGEKLTRSGKSLYMQFDAEANAVVHKPPIIEADAEKTTQVNVL